MESLSFLFTTTFFPPYHLGGDATHVYHLSCELAKRGHDVHVIHSLDSYHWQRSENPKTSGYTLPDNVTIYPIKSMIGRVEPVISYLSGVPFSIRNKFHHILNDIKPDILHHHNIAGFGPWVFGLDAPLRLYTAHDHWLICQMSGCLNYKNRLCYNPSNCTICSLFSGRPPQFWRYTNYLKRKLRNIDTIISPSEYLKGRLTESDIKVPIVVIPNFIPEPPEPSFPLFEEPYFLFVGVIEKYKGIEELVNLFIELKSKITRKLLIAGNGSELNYIKNIITRENCDKDIIILGRVDESTLSNLYTYADAVIIPSKFFENCPMVALEAIAHGTPIITSDIGGLPEITGKIDSGLIYKKPAELKEILLRINKNSYSTDLRGIFIDDYSIKNIDEFLKLCNSVIKAKNN